MAFNSTDQPVALSGTVAGAIQFAGSALLGAVAMFVPALTAERVAGLLGAFNALVMLANVVWAQRRAWSPASVEKVAAQAARTGDANGAVEAHA